MRLSHCIILASASARRKQLLEKAGYKFKVFPSNIDESNFKSQGVSPCKYAKQLALAKAKNVAEKFPDHLVIGADTVVDFDGVTIGKPSDERDARLIIEKIFGAPHKVITAVAIVRLSDNTNIVETDSTTVYPKKMSPEQTTRHLAAGAWRDKAGAYAIGENCDEFVEKIEGSLTNVMGLPMELLNGLLEKIIS
jgi:septum formation protein